MVSNGCHTGIEGLIRDHPGYVLGAFSKRLVGHFFPFISECLAIREDLPFVKDSGFRVSIVESDSVNVVRAIKDLCGCAAEFLILNDIKILMQ